MRSWRQLGKQVEMFIVRYWSRGRLCIPLSLPTGPFFGRLEAKLLPIVSLLSILPILHHQSQILPSLQLYLPFYNSTDSSCPERGDYYDPPEQPSQESEWVVCCVCIDMTAPVRLRTWDSSGHQPPI